ncbi:MAG: polyphosphate polymerase domain-containing protein [Candidatus Methanomethylophilaceae archaeon]|nr:polyphosphate polymerase domain-containing protein [Candidatus Methanomethylophilaceae archaeon]
MDAKTVFKRYELKYLMDEDQARNVFQALSEHMSLDGYGHSTIRNIYLDTEDFLLARRSIERPLYKEKLRIRSYGRPEEDGTVFVELKKKFDSVVYKRRVAMPLEKAMGWFSSPEGRGPRTQIGDEIDFMKTRYPGIRPAMLLTYEREAYQPKDGGDLRITMDSNILARLDDIDLRAEAGGHPVLPEGYSLMEVKTMYGYPAWLNSVLSKNVLYKSRFTKYGNAYKEMVVRKVPEEFRTLSGGAATVLGNKFVDNGEVMDCP